MIQNNNKNQTIRYENQTIALDLEVMFLEQIWLLIKVFTK